MSRLVALVVAAALAACGTFEDPAIVIDLRPLAMVADPTEYVIPFDPTNPPDPSEVVLEPFTITALVADPGVERALDWEMTMCAANVEQGDGRCRADHPVFPIGSGTIPDPDTDVSHLRPFTRFTPDASTYILLQNAIELDELAGFSGIELEVEMRVAPTGTSLAAGVYATKRMRFAAQIPIERTANTNPIIDQFDWDIGSVNGEPPVSAPMPFGRCVDLDEPFLMMQMKVGDTLYLTPQEPEGVRETYVVPTFDGGFRTFTENITYQWLAGDGEYTVGFTGGPKDPFGNDPPLHTEWTFTADDLAGAPSADVPIWVVMRDERLGARFYESCVRVLAN